MNFINSQLRQDLVSGDWIVIAPKRAKKPEQFIKKEKRIKAPIKGCPFENPQKSEHEVLNLTRRDGDWSLQIIKNKYPAFIHKAICPTIKKNGSYSVIDGVGYHNLLITRDHYKNFPRLNPAEAFAVFRAIQEHYRQLAGDKCVAYISMFHNWGPKAGASIYHPHYQIVAIPVVPSDIGHSLAGSDNYFKKNKKCVHCAIIEQEKKIKTELFLKIRERLLSRLLFPRNHLN